MSSRRGAGSGRARIDQTVGSQARALARYTLWCLEAKGMKTMTIMRRMTTICAGILLCSTFAAGQTTPAKPAQPAPETKPEGDTTATARKPCEDLKSEITKKLEDKGVKNYTLDIVEEKDVKTDDKVVGSCDGGTKRITYKRA
jgi:hypothetical protein